jgi:hypothetical protein
VTADAFERFGRDYAPAFLQYLSEGGERGRRAAYELGRRAISERLSILDLARIHHGVLLEVLKTQQTSQELEDIARGGIGVPRRGAGRLRDGASRVHRVALSRPAGRGASRGWLTHRGWSAGRHARPLKVSQMMTGGSGEPLAQRLAARSGAASGGSRLIAVETRSHPPGENRQP